MAEGIQRDAAADKIGGRGDVISPGSPNIRHVFCARRKSRGMIILPAQHSMLKTVNEWLCRHFDHFGITFTFSLFVPLESVYLVPIAAR